MFAILEILPRQKEKFERLRERLRQPEIYLEEVRGEGFTKYYIIRAREQSGGVPWENIAAVAGRCKNRLLVQENISLPEEGGFERFVPSRLPALILFNTGADILKKLNKKPGFSSVGVIDKNADAAENINTLIPHARAIKIYTGRPAVYRAAAEKIFYESGAGIIVSDDMGILNDCALTLSLNSDAACRPPGFILTFRPRKDTRTLALGKISVPDEYYLPPIEGISKFDFLCALYELADASKLEKLRSNTLFYSQNEIKAASAPEIISSFCNF